MNIPRVVEVLLEVFTGCGVMVLFVASLMDTKVAIVTVVAEVFFHGYQGFVDYSSTLRSTVLAEQMAMIFIPLNLISSKLVRIASFHEESRMEPRPIHFPSVL